MTMMIDLKQAYRLIIKEAEKRYRNIQITKCFDLGDRYAFSIRSNGEILIGAPIYTVEKATGAIGFLSIPPIENLELLKKSQVIDITDFNQL
jgi:hypothetical protein